MAEGPAWLTREAVAPRTRSTPASHNAATRTIEFVAATEDPVEIGGGFVEVLRMSGVDLKRYRSNPVVLNAHARRSVLNIVGRAPDLHGSGVQLVAPVQFSEVTDAGRKAYELALEGTLRALSIGYRVRLARELREGEEDGGVVGPALIALEWELLEVSVVPIPADPGALARSGGGLAAASTDPSAVLSVYRAARQSRPAQYDPEYRGALRSLFGGR